MEDKLRAGDLHASFDLTLDSDLRVWTLREDNAEE